MPTQVMMAAAPLLLAPRTDDVLVIGWGSGVSAGTALRWPIRRVTAIELEPAVIEASRLFEHINYQALDDSRLRLYEDDARHMLLASEDTYDVILSEPSHPWVTGVSNLFTREFFQLARVRLRPDGVFAQWVQAYEISFETYRTILATFQSVFPEVFVFVPPGTQDCILVGSRRRPRLDLAELERRWTREGAREEGARIGLGRAEHLLAVAYLGPDAVRTIVQGAPLNTDDNMYVEINGPREMIQAAPSGGHVVPALERAAVPIETMLTDRPTATGSCSTAWTDASVEPAVDERAARRGAGDALDGQIVQVHDGSGDRVQVDAAAVRGLRAVLEGGLRGVLAILVGVRVGGALGLARGFRSLHVAPEDGGGELRGLHGHLVLTLGRLLVGGDLRGEAVTLVVAEGRRPAAVDASTLSVRDVRDGGPHQIVETWSSSAAVDVAVELNCRTFLAGLLGSFVCFLQRALHVTRGELLDGLRDLHRGVLLALPHLLVGCHHPAVLVEVNRPHGGGDEQPDPDPGDHPHGSPLLFPNEARRL
ncbi:MAG: hypothetical protein E6J75_07370 [Deltaproteobacteria bacterium]|nr:MAG: hypothetical protein E6J75_07370 [Deltaproteobacteria bacterium]